MNLPVPTINDLFFCPFCNGKLVKSHHSPEYLFAFKADSYLACFKENHEFYIYLITKSLWQMSAMQITFPNQFLLLNDFQQNSSNLFLLPELNNYSIPLTTINPNTYNKLKNIIPFL